MIWRYKQINFLNNITKLDWVLFGEFRVQCYVGRYMEFKYFFFCNKHLEINRNMSSLYTMYWTYIHGMPLLLTVNYELGSLLLNKWRIRLFVLEKNNCYHILLDLLIFIVWCCWYHNKCQCITFASCTSISQLVSWTADQLNWYVWFVFIISVYKSLKIKINDSF